MEGGVMTTGQANGKGRRYKRHRTRHTAQQNDDQVIGYGQEFARLTPGADRLRRALTVTGSLGGASPPPIIG